MNCVTYRSFDILTLV